MRPGIALSTIAVMMSTFATAAVAEEAAEDPAPCPGSPALMEAADFAACFQEWETTGAVPLGLSEASLTAMDSLAKLDTLIEQAKAHVAARSGSNVVVASLEKARATVRARLVEQAFNANSCGEALVWCLDRDGAAFDAREVTPELFAGDRLTILVISSDPKDQGERITITARTIRSTVTLFPRTGNTGASAAANPTVFVAVARITTDIGEKAESVTIKVVRAVDAGGTDGAEKTHTLAVTAETHLAEFGVALVFLLDRDVTARGGVERGLEADLAFTLSVFPGGRQNGRPRQHGWSSVGLMFGMDITSPVREKRYFVGVDYSPIAGLALNAGLGIVPWKYVPPPDDVPDLMTGDIDPVERYRPTVFFGVRATPEVFDSARAAFKEATEGL